MDNRNQNPETPQYPHLQNPQEVQQNTVQQPVNPAPTVIVSQGTSSQPPQAVVLQPNIIGGHSQPLKKPKFYKSKLIVMAFVILVLLVVSGGVYVLFFHKTSYTTVAQEFVTAMENHDKAKADALMSPKGKSLLRQHEGVNSYYTLCQNTGQLCTYYFSSKFLSTTKVTSKNYYNSFYGVEEKEVLYTPTQTQSGGKGCNVNNSSSLAVYLEPKGNTWLVDGADPTTSFSANLCFQGGTSSSGN